MYSYVIPTADVKGKKGGLRWLDGSRSMAGTILIKKILKKESEREREKSSLKYIIKNSQNKGFSAMNAGGAEGYSRPPPHIFDWGGGGASAPPVPTPMLSDTLHNKS